MSIIKQHSPFKSYFIFPLISLIIGCGLGSGIGVIFKNFFKLDSFVQMIPAVGILCMGVSIGLSHNGYIKNVSKEEFKRVPFSEQTIYLYEDPSILFRFVSCVAALLAVITIIFACVAWYHMKVTYLYVSAANWVLAPPLWFWFEYFYIYKTFGKRSNFDQFKHGQQVSASIWAGLVICLFALSSSDRFKNPSSEIENLKKEVAELKEKIKSETGK